MINEKLYGFCNLFWFMLLALTGWSSLLLCRFTLNRVYLFCSVHSASESLSDFAILVVQNVRSQEISIA